MRRANWAIVAFAALGAGALGSFASPAAAADPYDYPWCIQGKQEGYPGYCGYQTFQQVPGLGVRPRCRLRLQSALRFQGTAADFVTAGVPLTTRRRAVDGARGEGTSAT